MRTVKEVSQISGISVRTLHYYDEIGLLIPTEINEAGYRLYDDKAIERLQRILYFREFDLPLKEIKSIIDHPDLDMDKLLADQRKLLNAKKERLERLVASIDDILKGENKMDFEVFSKADLEEVFQDIMKIYSEEQLQVLVRNFGSIEEYKQQYIANAARPQTQEHMAKMVEWYGDKELVKEFMTTPGSSKIGKAYNNRIEDIYRRIWEKKQQDIPVTDFQVKSLVGELDYVMKEFLQVKDSSLKNLISAYRTNPQLVEIKDKEFGPGMVEYVVDAIEAFCGEKS